MFIIASTSSWSGIQTARYDKYQPLFYVLLDLTDDYDVVWLLLSVPHYLWHLDDDHLIHYHPTDTASKHAYRTFISTLMCRKTSDRSQVPHKCQVPDTGLGGQDNLAFVLTEARGLITKTSYDFS